MTYFSASLIVLGAMTAAIVASRLAARLLPVETRRRHQEVGGNVFSQVGTLIAVLLAFVFSAVWGDYRSAAQAMNGECGALHGAIMMANTLPNDQGAPVIRAIATYTHYVVSSEWRTMAVRQDNRHAATILQTVVDSAARLDGKNSSDAATKAAILGLLVTAHADRETRLFQVTEGVPPVMWSILIAVSMVLVLFVALAGVEEPEHTIFVATFTGAIASVLVLVAMLDFPFEGSLALGPGDFVKLLREATVFPNADMTGTLGAAARAPA